MITVIIPIYKAEKYLPRCLDSLLAQSYTDFECILVDDGSPDNSGALCEEYASQHSCFKVIHKPNGGASSARNAGIDIALGEWVTFVDADDYLDSDYLESLSNVQTRTQTDFVLGGHKKYYANGDLKAERVYDEKFFNQAQFPDLLKQGLLVYQKAPWCKLFKREILNQNGIRFVPGAITGEDEIFMYSYFLCCKSLAFSSCKGYNYIEVEGSLTQKGIFPYKNEIISLSHFTKVAHEVYRRYPSYAWIMGQWTFYVSKVINAIYKESISRAQRKERLLQIDLKEYYRWRKPATVVEHFYLYFLGHNHLLIYDILMTLRR